MLSGRMIARLWRWLMIIGIWLGLGLFTAIENVVILRGQGLHLPWLRTTMEFLFMWLPWMLATPLILGLGRKTSLRPKPVSIWLKHIAAFVSISLVTAAWFSCLDELITPSIVQGSYWNDCLNTLEMQAFFYFVLYCSVLLVGYTIDYRQKLQRQQTEAAKLSEQLSKAQLSALRQQIQPHFLFNTLNAIVGLVRDGRNDDAVNMIVMLSELLLRVLKDSDRQEVPLGEELEFLHKYLHIQKIRFADRLTVRIDVPEDLLKARVPTHVLQPIVENAIKHGIAKRVQGGLIQITAARSDDSLFLDVYNEGPGLLPNKSRPGTGLSNMQMRLQALYGTAFSLRMRNQDRSGVEVSVAVPFREGQVGFA
jgi:two-component system, LytTR family, sensor kinase